MKGKYCQYCGELLEDCECVFDEIEDEDTETFYGWTQQDLIDVRKMER